jgi:hypothetical protein
VVESLQKLRPGLRAVPSEPVRVAPRPVLRTAAQAVRPGGLLLIVDHGSTAPWSWNQNPGGRSGTVIDNVCPSSEPEETVPSDRTRKHRPRTKDTGPGWTGPDEQGILLGFLDYLRSAIADKVADVPEPQVRTAGVPSGTNLLGLIKHLTSVERFYFLGEPIGNLRRTMRPTRAETVDGLLADYREAIAQANKVIEAWTDLTLSAPRPPGRSQAPSRRWVLVHMIEETGRHAGHADILREQIDGSTGR